MGKSLYEETIFLKYLQKATSLVGRTTYGSSVFLSPCCVTKKISGAKPTT
jgi:hypothetical protein